VVVERVEHSWDPFAFPLLVERVMRQVLVAGRIASLTGLGAPEVGWPPAANCIETVTARRAPLGQNAALAAVTDL
jgi:hypothetical protein